MWFLIMRESAIVACIVSEDNNGGVDGKKAFLHEKRRDAYHSDKDALVKAGYLVEVSDKDRKKII